MKLLAMNTAGKDAVIMIVIDGKIDTQQQWPSDRTLSDQLVGRIKSLVEESSITMSEIEGVIVHSGPGSFTSLRIGITVANTMSATLQVPIVGFGGAGNSWLDLGIDAFADNATSQQVLPNYGAEPNITNPRK